MNIQTETEAGIPLTEKQIKCIKKFTNALKGWDRNLQINAIAGTLHIMLRGDTEQNPIPDESPTGGFNNQNTAAWFPGIPCDGGDW